MNHHDSPTVLQRWWRVTAANASAVISEAAGVRQYVQFVVHGDYVFSSAGYGTGALFAACGQASRADSAADTARAGSAFAPASRSALPIASTVRRSISFRVIA